MNLIQTPTFQIQTWMRVKIRHKNMTMSPNLILATLTVLTGTGDRRKEDSGSETCHSLRLTGNVTWDKPSASLKPNSRPGVNQD